MLHQMSTLQKFSREPTQADLSGCYVWSGHFLTQFGIVHLDVASSSHQGLDLKDVVKEKQDTGPSGNTSRGSQLHRCEEWRNDNKETV